MLVRTTGAGASSTDWGETANTPTGVIATNDLVALGILRAMRHRGVDCPREISVIGFNDIQFAEDFCPPLSTVRVPMDQMGAEAAELLLTALAGGEPTSGTRSLPVKLVLRGSTSHPPGSI